MSSGNSSSASLTSCSNAAAPSSGAPSLIGCQADLKRRPRRSFHRMATRSERSTRTMNHSENRRWALLGLLAVVLWVVGIILINNNGPADHATGSEILAWYKAH